MTEPDENLIPESKVRKLQAQGVSKRKAKKMIYGKRKKKGKRRRHN